MSDDEGCVIRNVELDSESDSSSDEIPASGDEETMVSLAANHIGVDIASNYERLGRYVTPPPSPSSLLELKAKYPEAFSQESENALAAVLEDLQLPFTLTAFQTFAANALINMVDVFGPHPSAQLSGP